MTDHIKARPPAPPEQPPQLPERYRAPDGDSPMNTDRIRRWRDNPTHDHSRQVRELLKRCGPLVVDGRHYRLVDGSIESSPWYLHGRPESLGLGRRGLATLKQEGGEA